MGQKVECSGTKFSLGPPYGDAGPPFMERRRREGRWLRRPRHTTICYLAATGLATLRAARKNYDEII